MKKLFNTLRVWSQKYVRQGIVLFLLLLVMVTSVAAASLVAPQRALADGPIGGGSGGPTSNPTPTPPGG